MPFAARHNLLIISLVLSPHIGAAQHLPADSCKRFITGTFLVEGSEHIRIRRTARHQYETDSRNKTRSKYKIEWVGDCAYNITLIRTTARDRISRDKIGAVQPHIITHINGSRYTYTTTFSFLSADMCGTLTRMERKVATLIKQPRAKKRRAKSREQRAKS